MRVAVAQINCVLGDFKNNVKKITDYVQLASERHCELVIFPESTIFGYHPFDLLEREDLFLAGEKAIADVLKKIPKGITVILGAFVRTKNKKGRPFFNSAVILEKGKKPKLIHKTLLPTGDVFDEARFIEPGKMDSNVIKVGKKKIFITICEDIWAWPEKNGQSIYKENPITKNKIKGMDLVVNLSASPYYPHKFKKRAELVKNTAKFFKAPMLYVNLVGGQDEIIFDGTSFGVNAQGKITLQCLGFEEDFNIFELEKQKGEVRDTVSITEEIRRALVLGIRDFCEKNSIKKIHLGLSGGIDSSLVACLAVDALGPQNVVGIALPGPFTSEASNRLAEKLAKNLGIQFFSIPIADTYESAKNTVEKALNIQEFGFVHENLQARTRGLLLMAFSNKENSLLLSTSNKSEMATGYCTMYGDMCGGLSPIADLTKKQVYELSRHYNQNEELIPQEVLTRAPSAELRSNQKDQDSLPDYDELDAAVIRMVEDSKQPKKEIDHWLLQKISQTEFKRWQAPPVLKVSRHSFGRGRRWPIAHRSYR